MRIEYFRITYPDGTRNLNLNLIRQLNKVTTRDVEILRNNMNKFLKNSKYHVRHMTCKNIENEIKQTLSIQGIIPVEGIWKTFNKGPVYRSRIVKSKSQVDKWYKKHKILSEVSNPPSNKIHVFGRLNKPYQSVLYASWDIPTSFKEKHVRPNDLVLISVFSFDKPILLIPLGFGLHFDAKRIKYISNKYPKGYKILKLYNKFFQNVALQKVDPKKKYYYKYPVALAYEFMDYLKSKDTEDSLNAIGWVYPSVKFNYNSKNSLKDHTNICVVPGKNNYNLHNKLYVSHAVLVRAGSMRNINDLYKYVKGYFYRPFIS